jgi:hypothetical protein
MSSTIIKWIQLNQSSWVHGTVGIATASESDDPGF